jgi:pSer/pThr/pTyr-binding forkhead associated (FHA) protein
VALLPLPSLNTSPSEVGGYSAKADLPMKVSLVVAAGAHEGRQIPITGPQFLIGRDQQCHLRPASQAISKLHCAVLVRDGQVFVKDFGSTNGTMVNDAIVQGAEVAVEDGASVRVGPLDFTLKIEKMIGAKDGTPLPAESPEAIAAMAAAKAAAAKPPSRDATPSPIKPSLGTGQPAAPKSNPGTAKTASKAVMPALTQPAASATAPAKPGSQETPTPKSGTDTMRVITTSESVSDDDQERIAAMLLGMDDGGNGAVPDGSTVMDLPAALSGDTTETPKPDEKKDDKAKKAQTREEMSTAANDLLRKYMRRPK